MDGGDRDYVVVGESLEKVSPYKLHETICVFCHVRTRHLSRGAEINVPAFVPVRRLIPVLHPSKIQPLPVGVVIPTHTEFVIPAFFHALSKLFCSL